MQQRTLSLMQPGAMKAAFRFHQRVFDAIAGHDPDAAEREMEAHLQSVERYYWKTARHVDAPVRRSPTARKSGQQQP